MKIARITRVYLNAPSEIIMNNTTPITQRANKSPVIIKADSTTAVPLIFFIIDILTSGIYTHCDFEI
jgi:hypothetical protein